MQKDFEVIYVSKAFGRVEVTQGDLIIAVKVLEDLEGLKPEDNPYFKIPAGVRIANDKFYEFITAVKRAWETHVVSGGEQ